MKTALSSLCLLVLIVSPALADDCAKDIAKIDQALAKPDAVKPEDRPQLEDMRNQAVQLCGAGNTQEGLDVTGEAKAMLNIQ